MSTLSVIKSTGCPPSTYYALVAKIASGEGTEYMRGKWQTIVAALESGVSYVDARALAGIQKRPRFLNDLPCIYLLTCVESGRAYVGQSTRGIRYRDSMHRALRNRVRVCISEGITDTAGFCKRFKYPGGSTLLITEIFRHPDEESWSIELLGTCEPGTLAEMRAKLTPMEIAEITARGTLAPHGMNGNLGFQPTDDVRARLSAAGKGKPKSALQRERMSAAHKERWDRRKASDGERNEIHRNDQ